jgi:hypothetical protein
VLFVRSYARTPLKQQTKKTQKQEKYRVLTGHHAIAGRLLISS